MEDCTISVYVDGSCNTENKIGGWAAVVLISDKEIVLSGCEKNTTNNRMELISVIKAIKYVEENMLSFSKLIIYSDSQYICRLPMRIDKILKNNFITKSGKQLVNSDLLRIIFGYFNKLEINLIKVKAHQKEVNGQKKLNRFVDMLSRKIVRNETTMLNNK